MIVDGYVDEPTCLGVPPYISPYPRYLAGAIWTESPRTEVFYQTIDEVRKLQDPQNRWINADMLFLIAGMIVPGKYLGGTPVSVKEARRFFSDERIADIPKLLVGPWARFGCGLEGGRLALSSDVLSPPFDYIVRGDSEVVIADALKVGNDLSTVDLSRARKTPEEIREYSIRGAGVIPQHPGYPSRHLICEIETYRGCPRFITGGCSFCTEPLYGHPAQRTTSDVAREVEALYEKGVRAFRIGNQADLFAYGSAEIGADEFPKPNPAAIKELFVKVRSAAPEVEVLHIDNVNPGTLAHHPEESREVARIIISHHTPGDVAAFGVESLDPEVVRRNNLKADEDQVMDAVRLLNEVGSQRPAWGLPHLLPGINLLYGLLGESNKTLEHNESFLERLLEENLVVRRINIRQVISFDGTRLRDEKRRGIKKRQFVKHKNRIRETIDLEMIKRVAPYGTIIRSAFLEQQRGKSNLYRPLGTYPFLCQMSNGQSPRAKADVFVVDHGPRSLTVLPHPFKVSESSISQWQAVPGIGARRTARIKAAESIQSSDHLEMLLETELPEWLTRSLDFDES